MGAFSKKSKEKLKPVDFASAESEGALEAPELTEAEEASPEVRYGQEAPETNGGKKPVLKHFSHKESK